MQKFQRVLLAGAVALAVSAPAAAQVTGFTFFGDSLTDAGYFGSRWTVNPGLVWAQDLGATYGVAIRRDAPAAANAFVAYLLSVEGQRQLAAFGFDPP